MNKYEARAARERRAPIRSSRMIWIATILVVLIGLLILGSSTSASPSFFRRAAIGAALLLLLVRQLTRRVKRSLPRAAEPDPKSRLHLD